MMCFITVLVRMRPLTRAANGGNVHKLQAQPLPSDCLPTVGMVLAAYYFERELWAPTCPQGKVPKATWPCGHMALWPRPKVDPKCTDECSSMSQDMYFVCV